MSRLIFIVILIGAGLVVGCGGPEQTKASKQEIESFKGKPLTPEQVEKLRGSASQSGGSSSVPAGPRTGN